MIAVSLGYHPETRRAEERLRRLARRRGITFHVTSRHRGIAKQAELYKARQQGKHPLPVAFPGTSTHNYGIAFDAVSNDQSQLGALARAAGLVWAGVRDPVHFQSAEQSDWSEALTIHDARRRLRAFFHITS